MAPSGRLYMLDLGISTFPKISGRILTSHADGSDLHSIVSNLPHLPDGIAVDSVHNHIYWTNMGSFGHNDGSIQRCNLNGSNVETVVATGLTHTPKQLVIAPTSQKLYWCDREGMRVMRANLDGSNVEVLVQNGHTEEDRLDATKWCVGIAVDEKAGAMYWTQKGPSKGGKGRIFTAPLDFPAGESPDTRSDLHVLLDRLPEPVDLELDHANQVLYWTDRGEIPFGNTVNTVSLEGLRTKGETRTIVARKLHEGIGLALDPKRGRLFFADLSGGVYTARLDGSERSTIHEDVGDVTGIAYVDA